MQWDMMQLYLSVQKHTEFTLHKNTIIDQNTY